MNKNSLAFNTSPPTSSLASIRMTWKVTQGVGLTLLFITKLTQASPAPSSTNNSSEQIGNSYFKSLLIEPITQLGGAIERHKNSSALYVFFNQLTINHIFYELRAYGIYNDIHHATSIPALAPTPITTSNMQHPIGYGAAGSLGYNMNLSSNISLLPFTRLQALSNTFVAYNDSLGNQMGSADYSGSIGAKLSQRITDLFAIYVLGFSGYQWSMLSGDGIFNTVNKPTATLYFGGIEFGAPYKIYKGLSITGYAQVVIQRVTPNQDALNLVFPISQSNSLSSVFGIKFGYDF